MYSQLIDWYKMADTKGQLLLTLNGAFITILTGVVITTPEVLMQRKAQFGAATWVLLAAAAVSTFVSVISAVACLHSRLSNARLRQHAEVFIERGPGGVTYHPVTTFWFGTIAQLPREAGLQLYRSADGEFELDALSEEILLLSTNVLVKHRWVNRGWMAAGVTLLLLLAIVVSVVVEN